MKDKVTSTDIKHALAEKHRNICAYLCVNGQIIRKRKQCVGSKLWNLPISVHPRMMSEEAENGGGRWDRKIRVNTRYTGTVCR